jgi:hypothetical protein
MDRSSPERELAEQIAESQGVSLAVLGLRLDRVVLRLFEKLRASLKKELPKGMRALVAITAPIREPGKTGLELEKQILAHVGSVSSRVDRRRRVCGNSVRVRILPLGLEGTPRIWGLVHNPGSDPKQLLDLAERDASLTPTEGGGLRRSRGRGRFHKSRRLR